MSYAMDPTSASLRYACYTFRPYLACSVSGDRLWGIPGLFRARVEAQGDQRHRRHPSKQPGHAQHHQGAIHPTGPVLHMSWLFATVVPS